ncbi:MAG: hypothetical protein OEZ39_17100 [Gammaproteobacteria bacterium]|nr:hypothetical protein [Gammaproteobacteria bacterium]MDH5653580.1 hypothetical protein [Gammaproteobacteria bacterium]
MFSPHISLQKFVTDGYNNYKSIDLGKKIKNDSSTKCQVGMILYHKDKQIYAPKGKTGSGMGHAEMSALHNMIEYCESLDISQEQFAKNIVSGDFKIEVGCEEKSCCVQCSVVLGHFNAVAFDFDTVKCKKTMLGGGAWGMSQKVKAVLKYIVQFKNDKQTIKDHDLNAFCQASKPFFDTVFNVKQGKPNKP